VQGDQGAPEKGSQDSRNVRTEDDSLDGAHADASGRPPSRACSSSAVTHTMVLAQGTNPGFDAHSYARELTTIFDLATQATTS
jgi:hypothetical protein